MGHPPFSVLRHLPSKAVGVSFEITESDAKVLQHSCELCPHARMKAAPFHRSPYEHKLVSVFGDRVHMDLCGPLPSSNPHVSLCVRTHEHDGVPTP
eukprot:975940-Prymnesium_polylepis.1